MDSKIQELKAKIKDGNREVHKHCIIQLADCTVRLAKIVKELNNDIFLMKMVIATIMFIEAIKSLFEYWG